MDAIGYSRTFSGKPDLSAPKTSRAARSHRFIVPLSRVLSKTSRSTQPLTYIQCGLLIVVTSFHSAMFARELNQMTIKLMTTIEVSRLLRGKHTDSLGIGIAWFVFPCFVFDARARTVRARPRVAFS